MKKPIMQLAAGVLSLTLLAGCQPKADPDDMAYLTTGIRRDDALLSVDEKSVPAQEYLFWLLNAITLQKYSGNLVDDDAWEDTIEDTPTSEVLKNDALDTAKLYRVVRSKAEELNLALSEEDVKELDESLEEMETQLGGENAVLDYLESQCISLEAFRTLNEVYYLNQQLKEHFLETGELTVTDKDIDEFLEDSNVYAAAHILVATRRVSEDGMSYEEYTDEEKAVALQTAQDYYQQIQNAENKEETFYTLMREHSEDTRDESGNLYMPDGYTYIYEGQMTPAFEEAALALEIGGISEPVESNFGYHIILRLPVDRESAKLDCNEDYKFSKLTQEWLDSATVTTTKAYDELDPKAFYDKVQEVAASRKEARDATATPAPAESSSASPEGTEGESETPVESPVSSETIEPASSPDGR